MSVFESAKQIIHCIRQARRQHSELENLMWRDRILISEEMKLQPFLPFLHPLLGYPELQRNLFLLSALVVLVLWFDTHCRRSVNNTYTSTHTHSKVKQSNFLSFCSDELRVQSILKCSFLHK